MSQQQQEQQEEIENVRSVFEEANLALARLQSERRDLPGAIAEALRRGDTDRFEDLVVRWLSGGCDLMALTGGALQACITALQARGVFEEAEREEIARRAIDMHTRLQTSVLNAMITQAALGAALGTAARALLDADAALGITRD